MHCFGQFFGRSFGLSGLRTIGLSDYWAFGLSGLRTIGPSDYRAFGLLGRHRLGRSDRLLVGRESRLHSGADPGFQVRGAHVKKCAERREARKFLGYFVWKITILRQKIIFFPIAEGGAKFLGYFVWKITILRQKIIFFPILGGAPPLDPPLHI